MRDSKSSFKVFTLAQSIGLTDPSRQLIVKLLNCPNVDVMAMKLGRIRFNPRYPGMIDFLRETKGTEEIGFARDGPGKPDLHLKHHAGFLWDHPNRATCSNHPCKLSEEIQYLRITLRKERFQTVPSTGMPHVWRNKSLATTWTFPELATPFLSHTPDREDTILSLSETVQLI
jgi:hypothetical protein